MIVKNSLQPVSSNEQSAEYCFLLIFPGIRKPRNQFLYS